MQIEQHKIKEIDLKGATAVVSFPTVGMVGTIVANYLVGKMKLDLIGDIVSDDFFPVIIIHNGEPVPPVRIYGGDIVDSETNAKERIAIIMSEMPLKMEQFSPFADRIIDWCKENGLKQIITLEGINSEREIDGEEHIKVYSVGSLTKMDDRIDHLPVEHLERGMMSGLSGFLLYKGKVKNFPVFCFLTEAYSQFPDSRSAAVTISVLNKLFTKVDIDPQPLIEDAEKIEDSVRQAIKQMVPRAPENLRRENFSMYG